MMKAIYSKDHKYIIGLLKKARQEAGLSQVETANLLGRTQSHVSKVEAGQRRVDIVLLRELAKIYRKNISFFIH